MKEWFSHLYTNSSWFYPDLHLSGAVLKKKFPRKLYLFCWQKKPSGFNFFSWECRVIFVDQNHRFMFFVWITCMGPENQHVHLHDISICEPCIIIYNTHLKTTPFHFSLSSTFSVQCGCLPGLSTTVGLVVSMSSMVGWVESTRKIGG